MADAFQVAHFAISKNKARGHLFAHAIPRRLIEAIAVLLALGTQCKGEEEKKKNRMNFSATLTRSLSLGQSHIPANDGSTFLDSN